MFEGCYQLSSELYNWLPYVVHAFAPSSHLPREESAHAPGLSVIRNLLVLRSTLSQSPGDPELHVYFAIYCVITLLA
jgi:hypothetical protein